MNRDQLARQLYINADDGCRFDPNDNAASRMGIDTSGWDRASMLEARRDANALAWDSGDVDPERIADCYVRADQQLTEGATR